MTYRDLNPVEPADVSSDITRDGEHNLLVNLGQTSVVLTPAAADQLLVSLHTTVTTRRGLLKK